MTRRAFIPHVGALCAAPFFAMTAPGQYIGQRFVPITTGTLRLGPFEIAGPPTTADGTARVPTNTVAVLDFVTQSIFQFPEDAVIFGYNITAHIFNKQMGTIAVHFGVVGRTSNPTQIAGNSGIIASIICGSATFEQENSYNDSQSMWFDQGAARIARSGAMAALLYTLPAAPAAAPAASFSFESYATFYWAPAALIQK